MAIEKLSYLRTWTSPSDFPTYEDSEVKVRADLQYHPDAIRDFINNVLIKSLEADQAAGSLGAMDGAVKSTVQSVLDAHLKELKNLGEKIDTLNLGGRPPLSLKPGDIGAAPAEHTHDAGNINAGILPIVRGGTGADTAEGAQKALGLIPPSRTVSLSVSGWSGLRQTVTVAGVMADETKQLITVVPRSADKAAFDEAGVDFVSQAAGSLTFSAEKKPSKTIALLVTIQEVNPV